jgi:hypothetical protein
MTKYYMFTDAGDARVERLVTKIVAKAEKGKIARKDLAATIRKGCDSLERAGFGEVWDTEPQWAIADQITERVCEPQMWLPYDRWEG